MSKKMLKRSLALGALMAFVITGSAYAGLTIDETADSVSYKSDDWRWTINVNEDLDNKIVNVTSTANSLGLLINDKDLLANVKEINVTAGGGKTGLVINCTDTVYVNAPITLLGNYTDARIEIFDGGNVKIDTLNVGTVDAGPGAKLQLNDNAKATVNTINVINGYLSLQSCNVTADYANDQVEYTLGTVNLAEGTRINAVVPSDTIAWTDPSDTPDKNPSVVIKGDVVINLGKDAVADFGAEGHSQWRPGETKFEANSLTVNVEDASSNSAVYLSEGQVTTASDKINVIGVAENNTGDATKDLGKLAKIVKYNTRPEWEDTYENGEQVEEVVNIPAPIEGIKLTQEASNIYDAATGIVEVDENGNTDVKDIQVTKNSNTYGITENNALSLMTWRAEMNDMNKRMGELRNAEGQHGIWTRMVRGEAEYESVKNQYNQYQLGYDEKLSTDPSWTVGAAINYTEGDTSYSTGSAENKHVGFSVYGSKLNADGSFIDLIAKYARLENDFETTIGSGDYSSNGYSVSAEYGKRFTKENGMWIEPQVELTYGKVGSADYKMGSIDVAQDSIESLVGRVGFSLGKNISKGNVYARASYLYDFDGETAVNFVDGDKPRTMEQDLGGGWWEIGVGANINLSKATYIYADVEKTFGGEVDTNWQWNLGVRYSF